MQKSTTFNLCVDKNDIEELPAMVPGELADEELLEREQERIPEEKAREKQNCRRRKQRIPQENSQ